MSDQVPAGVVERIMEMLRATDKDQADALKEMAVAMRDHDKTVVKLAQNNTDHINTRLDKIEDQLESTTSLAKRAIFVGSIIIIAGALLMEALRSGWFVR